MEPGEIEKPRVDHPNNNKLQVVEVSHELTSLATDEGDKTTPVNASKVLEPCCDHELCQRTLLIRNIPHSMTQSEVWAYFTKYGRICYASILYNRRTVRSLGQAHVEYRDADSALKVISLPKDELCISGRYMKPSFNCWQKCRPCKEFKKIKQHHVDDENENEVDFPCYFDNLPDEVINHILSFFDFPERIRAERVCKRWQHVNTNSTWIGTRELVFEKIFIKKGSRVLTKKILVQILKRCGKSLREINFASCEHTLTSGFLLEIAKYCPNIESLNLRKTPVKTSTTKILMEVCKKIKSMIFNGCMRLDDESLSWILKGNNLKYLDLSKTDITGECFHLVKENLETLILHECMELSDEGFLHLKNSKIRDLRLNSFNQITSDIMVTVIESLKPTLRIFHLRGYFRYYDSQTLHAILNHCENLQELYLDKNNLVEDDILNTIATTCVNLSHLNISENVITDECLCNLNKLPHLRNLYLNYVLEVTEVSLVEISQRGELEHLEIRGCALIADEDCVTVVTNCPKLKLLDVSSCPNITDAFVVELCDLELGDNRHKLEIIAGGTGITKFIENDRVKVSESNLCALYYQPEPWLMNDNVQYYSDSDSCDSDDAYDYVMGVNLQKNVGEK